MKWEGRRQSDNVEDQRDGSSGGAPGGLGRGGFRMPSGGGMRVARGGGLSTIILMVVVLPAPFGPRKPKISPGLTVIARSSTALILPLL